jgi:uncharacterized protein YdhG (YjbR/CyaY superfamily)
MATRSSGAKPRRASSTATGTNEEVWSKAERDAIRETARERRQAAKVKPGEERAAGEAAIRASIDQLPEPDRSIALRVHELVTAAAPDLIPRTFYGSPGWEQNGKTLCYFQAKAKYKARYHTFGYLPEARLDEGDMWPIAFAIDNLTPSVEARIRELVRKAAG